MRRFQFILHSLCCLVLLLKCVSTLKFDIEAHPEGSGKGERCIRNFVSKDTLVVITAIVSGTQGDGMIVNINVKDAVGNEYAKSKNVVGEKHMAFTSHIDASFDVCLTNYLSGYAKDWGAVQHSEKLKPVETELRRIEETVGEVVAEMEYLRSREQKLRDTNESTNTRVKWFAFSSMGMLVALGLWQIIYLRAYFR